LIGDGARICNERGPKLETWNPLIHEVVEFLSFPLFLACSLKFKHEIKGIMFYEKNIATFY